MPEDISRIQRLNRAIMKPRLITAMLVRTQARKVRSLARISDSILSGWSRPFSPGDFAVSGGVDIIINSFRESDTALLAPSWDALILIVSEARQIVFKR